MRVPSCFMIFSLLSLPFYNGVWVEINPNYIGSMSRSNMLTLVVHTMYCCNRIIPEWTDGWSTPVSVSTPRTGHLKFGHPAPMAWYHDIERLENRDGEFSYGTCDSCSCEDVQCYLHHGTVRSTMYSGNKWMGSRYRCTSSFIFRSIIVDSRRQFMTDRETGRGLNKK